MSKELNYDAIVIGAGHNGLTTANLLSKRGYKVLCCEQREDAGGLAKGDQFHPDFYSCGFYHDASAVRSPVIDLFNLTKFGLSFDKFPQEYFIPDTADSGKPGILISGSLEHTQKEISAYSEEDAESWKEFRGFLSRTQKTLMRILTDEVPNITHLTPGVVLELGKKAVSLRMLGQKDMMELLRVAPMAAADWMQDTFETKLLQIGVAFPTCYGSWTGPWSPATSTNVLAWESTAQYSVTGGVMGVLKAMLGAAKENGVEVRTGCKVEKIISANGIAKGVQLADGEQVFSKVVISNADPKTTFLKLLPPLQLPQKEIVRIENLRTRAVTAKVNLAIKGDLRYGCRPDLTIKHARISPTLDDTEKAFDHVKYGEFSENPALDVYVASADEPLLCPEGHNVVSILVHYAPYDLRAGWSDETKSKLYENVINQLERYVPKIREQIIGHETLSPVDIEERYGCWGGHLNHGEQGLDQLLMRPTPDCAEYSTPIKDLYLCGSGSYPGGGFTCAPGLLAATEVLKQL
jgi:phytoene dehydrogenase-like protein